MGMDHKLLHLDCFACQDVGTHGTAQTDGEFATHDGQLAKNCILSIDTSIKKFGAASLKVERTGAGDAAFDYMNDPLLAIGSTSGAKGRWVYADSGKLPSAGVVTLFGLSDCVFAGIDSAGKLNLVDGGGVSKAVAASALTVDTWYWVAVRFRRVKVNVSIVYLRYWNDSGVEQGEELNAWAVSSTTSTVSLGVAHVISSTFTYHLDGGIAVGGGAWPPICPGFVDSIVPTGQGNYNNWTSSVPGNKWLDVDEIPDNADADYIYISSTALETFTHAASGIPGTPNVLAIGLRTMARLSSGAFGTYQGLLRLGVTDMVGDTAGTAATYQAIGRVLTQTKPGGGGWTETDVDNVEIGVRSFSFFGTTIRCTNIVLYAAYGDDWVDDHARKYQPEVI